VTLARFEPLIQPFTTDKATTAEHEMRQLWHSRDFAAKNVVYVRLGHSENLGDFLDRQNA
jgi:hypothetical protein